MELEPEYVSAMHTLHVNPKMFDPASGTGSEEELGFIWKIDTRFLCADNT